MVEKVWEIGEPRFEADQECSKFRIWPWHGHRRFAYDLIQFIKPERIVELGTYWGTSFFAFCQAVKDFNLATECVAIDTWEGDEHTGKYDSEAFETFCQIEKQLFSNINIRQLKMRFDDALNHIDDDSVDLLHIDGCHEYDAIKKDFESWLPKLTKNAIVLFHDVADDVDYGSVRYWKEVSTNLPYLVFQHSWGLGVLFPKDQIYYQQILANRFDEKMKIYEYRSELEYVSVYLDDFRKKIIERDNLINEQRSLLLEKDGLINQKENQLEVQKQLSHEIADQLKKLNAELETEKKRRLQIESSFLFRVGAAFSRALNPK